jgi:hypothetical protein
MVAVNKRFWPSRTIRSVGPETWLSREPGFYREDVIDSLAVFGFTGGGLG